MKQQNVFSFILLLTAVLILFAGCEKSDAQAPFTEATAHTAATEAESLRQTAKTVYHYASATQDSAFCYAAPKPGTFFCFMEVNAAREQNKNDPDTKYLLKMDVFNEQGIVSAEQLQAEYARLEQAGIRFFECDYWTYVGAQGQKEYRTEVLGLFTEQDLANFTPLAEYGYAFSFLINGDSSAIEWNENSSIKNF